MAENEGALLESLMQIREQMGRFHSDIRTLFQRAAEDRVQHEREHRENQTSMGELRQSTTASIAELRQATMQSLNALSAEVQTQSRKLDLHAADVKAIRGAGVRNALNVSRRQLAIAGAMFTALAMLVVWFIEAIGAAAWAWLRAHVH